jgi:hypothetical protein
MRTKRTSLDALMKRNINESPSATAAPPPAEAVPKPARREKVKGTRPHTVYIPHAAHRLLRKLAFDEEGSMHDYLIEGLDLVFRQKGLPSIAELKAKEGEG